MMDLVKRFEGIVGDVRNVGYGWNDGLLDLNATADDGMGVVEKVKVFEVDCLKLWDEVSGWMKEELDTVLNNPISPPPPLDLQAFSTLARKLVSTIEIIIEQNSPQSHHHNRTPTSSQSSTSSKPYSQSSDWSLQVTSTILKSCDLFFMAFQEMKGPSTTATAAASDISGKINKRRASAVGGADLFSFAAGDVVGACVKLALLVSKKMVKPEKNSKRGSRTSTLMLDLAAKEWIERLKTLSHIVDDTADTLLDDDIADINNTPQRELRKVNTAVIRQLPPRMESLVEFVEHTTTVVNSISSPSVIRSVESPTPTTTPARDTKSPTPSEDQQPANKPRSKNTSLIFPPRTTSVSGTGVVWAHNGSRRHRRRRSVEVMVATVEQNSPTSPSTASASGSSLTLSPTQTTTKHQTSTTPIPTSPTMEAAMLDRSKTMVSPVPSISSSVMSYDSNTSSNVNGGVGGIRLSIPKTPKIPKPDAFAKKENPDFRGVSVVGENKSVSVSVSNSMPAPREFRHRRVSSTHGTDDINGSQQTRMLISVPSLTGIRGTTNTSTTTISTQSPRHKSSSLQMQLKRRNSTDSISSFASTVRNGVDLQVGKKWKRELLDLVSFGASSSGSGTVSTSNSSSVNGTGGQKMISAVDMVNSATGLLSPIEFPPTPTTPATPMAMITGDSTSTEDEDNKLLAQLSRHRASVRLRTRDLAKGLNVLFKSLVEPPSAIPTPSEEKDSIQWTSSRIVKAIMGVKSTGGGLIDVSKACMISCLEVLRDFGKVNEESHCRKLVEFELSALNSGLDGVEGVCFKDGDVGGGNGGNVDGLFDLVARAGGLVRVLDGVLGVSERVVKEGKGSLKGRGGDGKSEDGVAIGGGGSGVPDVRVSFDVNEKEGRPDSPPSSPLESRNKGKRISRLSSRGTPSPSSEDMTAQQDIPDVLEAYTNTDEFSIIYETPNTTLYKKGDPAKATPGSDNKIVKFATVKKLVERITHHKIRDPGLVTVVLNTYGTFTNSREVVELLYNRVIDSLKAIEVHGAVPSHLVSDYIRHVILPVRISVLRFVTRWIRVLPREFRDRGVRNRVENILGVVEGKSTGDGSGDEELLGEMGQPAVVNMMGVYVTGIRNLLVEVADNRTSRSDSIKTQATPWLSPTSPKPPLSLNTTPHPHPNSTPASDLPISLLNVDPLIIAQHMLILDRKIYMSISPSEFLNQTHAKPGTRLIEAPGVVALVERFNFVVGLVTTAVMGCGTPMARAEMISHFVRVAKHSLDYRNLNASHAILSALSSASLHRLTKTWQKVPKSIKSTLQQLQQLFSPNSNFAKLRDFLSSLSSAASASVQGTGTISTTALNTAIHQGAYCVPWLGLHVRDNDVYGADMEPLVNLFRCRWISRCVAEALRFQGVGVVDGRRESDAGFGIGVEFFGGANGGKNVGRNEWPWKVNSKILELLVADDGLLKSPSQQFEVSLAVEPRVSNASGSGGGFGRGDNGAWKVFSF
ncbi:RasGEF [Blyttiomyces sp. JEL0837]|nr:RasGEF [Blyttiomyces sp. JEL0837]